ncbi:MAG: peptidyl-prolyl cis-trans isomerase A (cyclophilin A) [Patiriisocius sp.]|jgi:peptidyl-prolyl cis-trans isomerase A (cyclophilin A)
MQDGIYVKITTEKGTILGQLTYKRTPGTVANFVALAEGNLENKAKPQGIPYYDGLTFHRVISDFMVQGGDPEGSGSGGPGYQFDDEFHPELKHDKPGVFSMANSGPATNGSQFFITHIPTDWLDNKHSVFGYVVEGQDVVNTVAQGDTMNMEIIRVGAEAEAFNAVEVFRNFTGSKAEREAAAKQDQEAGMKDLVAGFDKTDSGLHYKIIQKGDGVKPTSGQTVAVHYKGMLPEGTTFDSSYDRGTPIEFPIGMGHVIAGWDEGIMLLNKGDKARFVIPSDLGYGAQGAGGVIPPNATLVFDVELMDIKG